ncbi:hypothetical protein OIU77_020281 [Salix suchowensis]|uniref:Uncharacterized protein n=1 Tax=Salix suchowensis TaxID=1278906 RepID=A0ABQ9CJ41_9ROSI|nr:hypothetical protein OIU77_020281 [Salix suchowensis]
MNYCGTSFILCKQKLYAEPDGPKGFSFTSWKFHIPGSPIWLMLISLSLCPFQEVDGIMVDFVCITLKASIPLKNEDQ